MLLLFSLIFVVISGCSTDNQPPADNNNITESITGINGTIKSISSDANNNVNAITVDGKEEITGKTHYYDRAKVSFTSVTKIYVGESEEEFSANELKEGMNVKIIFYGPIAESFPVQAKAKTIRVFE